MLDVASQFEWPVIERLPYRYWSPQTNPKNLPIL